MAKVATMAGAFIPTELNEPSDGGGCTPTVDTTSCTATVNCVLPDGTEVGSETVTGGTFTATVTITDSGSGVTESTYNISGTIS